MVSNPDYDLFIIGGGFHGICTARDAAGRGLKVLLAEQGDLAWWTATSNQSHGGIRYVPQGQLKLVIKALRDRERNLINAPHLTYPMELILVQDNDVRAFWQWGVGFAIYDTFAMSKIIPRAFPVKLDVDPRGSLLKEEFSRGYQYGDGYTDDSLLIVANAMDAREHGADIRTRTRCTRIEPRDGYWVVTVEDENGQKTQHTAKTVLNATGAAIRKVLAESGLETADVPEVDLIKGSHIITRKLYEGAHSYMLPQPSGQVIFVSPFNGFTRIGPTEEEYDGDPRLARPSQKEINYLLNGFNKVGKIQLSKSDILATDSAVRQMLSKKRYQGAGKARREHLLYQHKDLSADLISVFGGKMTTARTLAEEAVNMIAQRQGKKLRPWTSDAVLPGGDMPNHDFDAFLKRKEAQYAWLDPKTLHRYARSYGTRMDRFLEGARSVADLGQHYGDGLHEAEIVYLKQETWAKSADDVLRRRSKMYLTASPETVKNLELALA